MESVTKKIEFQPRPNLRRTLEYRPHLRWTYYSLLLGAAGFALSTVALASVEFLRGNSSSAVAAIFAGMALPAILLLEALFLIRPLAFAKIRVEPDGLSLETIGKTVNISFSEIESVHFASVPYMGGWFRLNLASKKKYRFTVVLERSEYILEAIAAARGELISINDLEKYRRTAILSDHSWARFYGAFKAWPKLLIKFFVLPLALAAIGLAIRKLFFNQGPLPLKTGIAFCFFILAANGFIGVAAWYLGEITLMAKGRSALLADPQSTRRDTAVENKITMRASWLHLILTSALYISFMIFGLFK